MLHRTNAIVASCHGSRARWCRSARLRCSRKTTTRARAGRDTTCARQLHRGGGQVHPPRTWAGQLKRRSTPRCRRTKTMPYCCTDCVRAEQFRQDGKPPLHSHQSASSQLGLPSDRQKPHKDAQLTKLTGSKSLRFRRRCQSSRQLGLLIHQQCAQPASQAWAEPWAQPTEQKNQILPYVDQPCGRRRGLVIEELWKN